MVKISGKEVVIFSGTRTGLEIIAGGTGIGTRDGITLSADLRTVTLDLRDGGEPDDIRIITAVPEPGSLSLLAVASLLIARRWRRV